MFQRGYTNDTLDDLAEILDGANIHHVVDVGDWRVVLARHPLLGKIVSLQDQAGAIMHSEAAVCSLSDCSLAA